MALQIDTQQIVLEQILRRLAVVVEPAAFHGSTMVVELDEGKLIDALGTIMNRYIEDYKRYTLSSLPPANVDKILIRIGDYEVEAKEHFTTHTKHISTGYKKA